MWTILPSHWFKEIEIEKELEEINLDNGGYI